MKARRVRFSRGTEIDLRLLVTTFAALAMNLAVCVRPGMSAENWPDALNDHVMEVRKLVNTIGMDDYLDVVKNSRDATIIDVRDEDELKAGMVPAAINISRGRLEFRIWRAFGYPTPVDTGRRIYVQCATGGRATLAAKQLKDIGFTNVVAVIVSMADWEKLGYPLVKAALPRN